MRLSGSSSRCQKCRTVMAAMIIAATRGTLETRNKNFTAVTRQRQCRNIANDNAGVKRQHGSQTVYSSKLDHRLQGKPKAQHRRRVRWRPQVPTVHHRPYQPLSPQFPCTQSPLLSVTPPKRRHSTGAESAGTKAEPIKAKDCAVTNAPPRRYKALENFRI